MIMDLEQKYIEVNKYYLDDDFLESLDSMDKSISSRIADYIDENIWYTKFNDGTDTVLSGVIDDNVDTPITFQLEVYKSTRNEVTLSDVYLITMDDYLDMYNMKLTLPYRGAPKAK